METTLTMFIHGPPGVGKSWLADTVPGPRVVLDAEGRAQYTPSGPKVQWDPMRYAPPEPGDWDTAVVRIGNFNQMAKVYEWLQSGQHCFTSVVIDSLMEIQKRCIDNIAGVEIMKTQDWGQLLRKMEAMVRSFRDLAGQDPNNPVRVVVATCGTVQRDGQFRPLLQGQLGDTVPHFFDVVGQLGIWPDENGVPTRQMLVAPATGFTAKDGTDRMPAVNGMIPIPDHTPVITNLMEHLHVNGKKEAL